MTAKGGSRPPFLPATHPSPSLNIRAARIEDGSFIAELSRQVFSQFGDYAAFLPSYLDEPAVLTSVAEQASAPLGFSMLSFVVAEPETLATTPSAADQELFAEILAIAVSPAHLHAGIGRQLMLHALAFAEECTATSRLTSVQLNVAHTNTRARTFFEAMGFEVLNQNDGTYPEGQRSIRMIHWLAHSLPMDHF